MSKNYNFIVAITGKSSSGKDTIARLLANQHGFNYVVSTTSRPMRSNETNHIDYHFITPEEFQQIIVEDKLIEYRCYETIQSGQKTKWEYGIERDAIDLSKGNFVAVVDLEGLQDLKREFGYRVISFYIDVNEESRKTRAIGRDRNFEVAEWDRRCKSDDERFDKVELDVNEIVRNDNFDECLAGVLYKIKHIKDMRQFFTQYASV